MNTNKQKLSGSDLGQLFGGKGKRKPRNVPGPKKNPEEHPSREQCLVSPSQQNGHETPLSEAKFSTLKSEKNATLSPLNEEAIEPRETLDAVVDEGDAHSYVIPVNHSELPSTEEDRTSYSQNILQSNSAVSPISPHHVVSKPMEAISYPSNEEKENFQTGRFFDNRPMAISPKALVHLDAHHPDIQMEGMLVDSSSDTVSSLAFDAEQHDRYSSVPVVNMSQRSAEKHRPISPSVSYPSFDSFQPIKTEITESYSPNPKNNLSTLSTRESQDTEVRLSVIERRSLLNRTRQFGLMAPSALLNLMESVSVLWRQEMEERMTSKDMFIEGAILSIEERIRVLRDYQAPESQLLSLEEKLKTLKQALT